MARGNPAMRAKRVTGPTPNTELLTRVKCETCDVKGCNERPLLTDGRGGTITRKCTTHVGYDPRAKQARIIDTGWKPPWCC
jgi:hypothetical protein